MTPARCLPIITIPIEQISISARLQEIIGQILPHVEPALINYIGELDDLLGSPLFFGAAAAFVNIVQESGLEILDGLCMRICCSAIGAVAYFRDKLAAFLAFVYPDLYDVVIPVYSREFEFRLLFFGFFQKDRLA